MNALPKNHVDVVREGYSRIHDNGNILPRDPVGDMLAVRLRALYEQKAEISAKVALVEAELCAAIGVNAGLETCEGRITWKMGPSGEVDWRAVALELGAEKAPSIVAAHRGPARRRLNTPRAWKKAR